jgi:hypothetical protein
MSKAWPTSVVQAAVMAARSSGSTGAITVLTRSTNASTPASAALAGMARAATRRAAARRDVCRKASDIVPPAICRGGFFGLVARSSIHMSVSSL